MVGCNVLVYLRDGSAQTSVRAARRKRNRGEGGGGREREKWGGGGRERDESDRESLLVGCNVLVYLRDGSAQTSVRAAKLLSHSQYTDTSPTSPRADPIAPDAWQGSK